MSQMGQTETSEYDRSDCISPIWPPAFRLCAGAAEALGPKYLCDYSKVPIQGSGRWMIARDEPEITETWLVNLPPTPRQTWLACAVAAILLVGLGVSVPLADKPLPRVDALSFHHLKLQYSLLILLPQCCCLHNFRFTAHAHFWR